MRCRRLRKNPIPLVGGSQRDFEGHQDEKQYQGSDGD
jgi:hypothetical protein